MPTDFLNQTFSYKCTGKVKGSAVICVNKSVLVAGESYCQFQKYCEMGRQPFIYVLAVGGSRHVWTAQRRMAGWRLKPDLKNKEWPRGTFVKN